MRDGKTAAKKPGHLVLRGRVWVRSVRDSFFQRFNASRRKRRYLFLKIASFLKKEVSAETETVAIDIKRRAFLKYAMFGGAVFLVGKYASPVLNMLRGDTVLSEKTFENFKITETGKQLRVSDNDGEDLLIIDKEDF